MNKYKNKKCVIDGYKFDSLTEGHFYKDVLLKTWCFGGEYELLQLQPEFILQEGFKKERISIIEKGKRKTRRIRKRVYKSDFLLRHKSGQLVVIDIKGTTTAEYRLKRSLFLKLYGADYIFYEINYDYKEGKIIKIREY